MDVVAVPPDALKADAPWPALPHGLAESAATGVAELGAATMATPPTIEMA
jgi:hypothetical protein